MQYACIIYNMNSIKSWRLIVFHVDAAALPSAYAIQSFLPSLYYAMGSVEAPYQLSSSILLTDSELSTHFFSPALSRRHSFLSSLYIQIIVLPYCLK